MRTAQTACARLLAACAATALGSTLALAAGPEVIYSEIAGHNSSLVPGAVDGTGNPMVAHWTAINGLTVDPAGRWLVKGFTDQVGTTFDTLLLGNGAAGSMFQQEGAPVPGGAPGEVWSFFDFDVLGGFNDAGQMAFSARTEGTPNREVIMTSDGVTTSLFLAQGDPLSGLTDPDGLSGDETLGNTVQFVHRLNDGRVAYRTDNIGSMFSLANDAIMFDSGPPLLQGGVSSVVDLFGNPQLWDGITDFAMSLDGAHYIAAGHHDGSTSVDGIIVVDGTVVAQEDSLIPGTFEIMDDVNEIGMLPDGTWFARGDEADLSDWALRNGQLVARTGDPITLGSGELWGDSIIDVTGNVAGSYVVAGSTDNADLNADSVVVFEGNQVVLREGDPVDLDGNGLFDDNVFIRSFNTSMWLSRDFQLYFLCILQDGTGASLGDAFLRYQILTPTPGDVAVQISDSPDPLGLIGGQIAYSVTVRNFSPDPATNVVVTTNLDPTTSFVSSTAGSHSGGVHTANFGVVPALTAQTYQIVVQANAAGTPAATASVAATETDPNPANNSATTDTAVMSLADLTVAVVDSPDPMNLVDGQITYDITVTNNGPSTANNVVLTANLAPESTFVSTTAGSHSGGVVTANLGNLADGAVANVAIVVDTSVNGSYVASIDAASTTTDPAAADNNAIATTEVLVDANLAVAASIDPPALGGIGQQATYTLEITNAGPTDATGVDWSLSLPAEVTYISSSAGMHSGGVVSGSISSIAVDATEIITVTIESSAIGDDLPATFTAGPTVPSDADLTDNSAAATLTIFDPDAAPPARVILTNDEINEFVGATLPSSLAPGLDNVVFAGFDRPFISANGRNWIMRGSVAPSDNVVIFSEDSVVQIAAQEGVTAFPDGSGSLVGATIDAQVSINDAGEYVFHTTASDSSGIDAILKGTGSNLPGSTGTLTLIAKDLNPVPNVSPGNYAALESPVINNDGKIWMVADTDLSPTTSDEYVLTTTDDGATMNVVIQEGVTPVLDGFLWGEFEQNRLYVTGDGAHTLLDGNIDGAGTTEDAIIAYDNTIVLQENVTLLDGFSSTLDGSTPVDEITLAHNGDWYARGSNNDDTHWVVRNGQVLARSGDPLFAGSSEVWRFSSTSNAFNMVAGDVHGNYVVGGYVESPGDNTMDQVLVLNNERIILRELDPIDIDGDGVFDDNTFVKDIGASSTGNLADKAVITADGKLVVMVTIRGFESISNIGDAVIELDLGLAPACVCETDGDANQVNVFDLLAYLDHWFPQDAEADIDGTPGVDVFDLLFYLDCWFPASAGSPC